MFRYFAQNPDIAAQVAIGAFIVIGCIIGCIACIIENESTY